MKYLLFHVIFCNIFLYIILYLVLPTFRKLHYFDMPQNDNHINIFYNLLLVFKFVIRYNYFKLMVWCGIFHILTKLFIVFIIFSNIFKQNNVILKNFIQVNQDENN